jgi:hypothetical protein
MVNLHSSIKSYTDIDDPEWPFGAFNTSWDDIAQLILVNLTLPSCLNKQDQEESVSQKSLT